MAWLTPAEGTSPPPGTPSPVSACGPFLSPAQLSPQPSDTEDKAGAENSRQVLHTRTGALETTRAQHPRGETEKQEALETSTGSLLKPGQTCSGESVRANRGHQERPCCRVLPSWQRGRGRGQAAPERLGSPAPDDSLGSRSLLPGGSGREAPPNAP